MAKVGFGEAAELQQCSAMAGECDAAKDQVDALRDHLGIVDGTGHLESAAAARRSM